ncbi:MAG: hypothetical protein Q4A31_11080 [Corynebacterium sp.]|uniref:hypothetical protein n=1 Tax=Corynebacterium sp. TaxID=1720 RepID=UPI0026DD7616|nr:hypothetical protein [Corynebacterium sp.]MDO4762453.1 hypothetical protein [Corynebacterium sp.]
MNQYPHINRQAIFAPPDRMDVGDIAVLKRLIPACYWARLLGLNPSKTPRVLAVVDAGDVDRQKSAAARTRKTPPKRG